MRPMLYHSARALKGLLPFVMVLAVIALLVAPVLACDVYGQCGAAIVQPQAYAQAYVAPVVVQPAPVLQTYVPQQVVVQPQVQAYAAAPVVAQAKVHAAPLRGRAVRGRLFGGRQVARSRSVVRGSAASSAVVGY